MWRCLQVMPVVPFDGIVERSKLKISVCDALARDFNYSRPIPSTIVILVRVMSITQFGGCALEYLQVTTIPLPAWKY